MKAFLSLLLFSIRVGPSTILVCVCVMMALSTEYVTFQLFVYMLVFHSTQWVPWRHKLSYYLWLPSPGVKLVINKYLNKRVIGYVCSGAQSCPTLFDPMDCSPLNSSVHGIFQARILEWVGISSSRGSSWPRDRTLISCKSPTLACRFFTTEPQG